MTIAHLKALLSDVTSTNWRVAKFLSMDRGHIMTTLSEQWVCGPDSVADECMFVLGIEPTGAEVTTCVVGNGPNRNAIVRAIVALHTIGPDLIAVAEAAGSYLRYHDEWTASVAQLRKDTPEADLLAHANSWMNSGHSVSRTLRAALAKLNGEP